MPSTETDHSKLTVEEMALRFRAAMVPLARLAELREPTMMLIEQVGLR